MDIEAHVKKTSDCVIKEEKVKLGKVMLTETKGESPYYAVNGVRIDEAPRKSPKLLIRIFSQEDSAGRLDLALEKANSWYEHLKIFMD